MGLHAKHPAMSLSLLLTVGARGFLLAQVPAKSACRCASFKFCCSGATLRSDIVPTSDHSPTGVRLLVDTMAFRASSSAAHYIHMHLGYVHPSRLLLTALRCMRTGAWLGAPFPSSAYVRAGVSWGGRLVIACAARCAGMHEVIELPASMASWPAKLKLAD